MTDTNYEELERHPLSAIWPDMSPEVYKDLKKSLVEDGLKNPIVLDENNLIVDGYHRYKAIQELKDENIHVAGECYEITDDPVATVRVHHLAKRELTKLQRAEAVVKMYKWVEEQENSANGDNSPTETSAEEKPKKLHKHQKQVKSTREMAQEAGTSKDTIRKAQKNVAKQEGKPEEKPRRIDKPAEQPQDVKLTEKQKMADEILRLRDEVDQKAQKIVDLEERIAHMEEGGGDSKALVAVQEQLAMCRDAREGAQRRATQLSGALKTAQKQIADLEDKLAKYEINGG